MLSHLWDNQAVLLSRPSPAERLQTTASEMKDVVTHVTGFVHKLQLTAQEVENGFQLLEWID